MPRRVSLADINSSQSLTRPVLLSGEGITVPLEHDDGVAEAVVPNKATDAKTTNPEIITKLRVAIPLRTMLTRFSLDLRARHCTSN